MAKGVKGIQKGPQGRCPFSTMDICNAGCELYDVKGKTCILVVMARKLMEDKSKK